MSSRREKEKRLRPRHDPYKRDHFDKSKYLRIPATTASLSLLDEDHMANIEEFEDEYDDDLEN